eukprot:Awhi_evm1s13528
MSLKSIIPMATLVALALSEETCPAQPVLGDDLEISPGNYADTLWRHENVRWRCTCPGKIALTFDDGPGPDSGNVLDVLKELGVPATFFIN